MRSRILSAVVAVAILLLPTGASRAALIASDSFAVSAGGQRRGDYVRDMSIVEKNPTLVTRGFDGAWGNPPLDIFLPTAGGLTHPMSPGTKYDGQLIVNGTQGSAGGFGARNLSRAIDYTPTDGTYYSSLLLRKDSATNRADLLAGLGRSQDANTNILGVDGTWIGFIDGGISFFWDTAHARTLLPAAQTNVGETYFALLQYDFSTSGPDAVTATIYNGASEEVATDQFTDLNLDQTMGRFSVLTQDYGPIPIIDEWRFGTTRSDVAYGVDSLIYEFHGDADIFFDKTFATLELARLPATHEDVRSLRFTLLGEQIFDHESDTYLGTFDTSTGPFLSDGEGGLVGLGGESLIRDLDPPGASSPTTEFVLGANFAFTNDSSDFIEYRNSGGVNASAIGTWRLVPRSSEPEPPNPTGNLLVNPGFESHGQGWTEFGHSAFKIAYRESFSGPHEGSLALRLSKEQSASTAPEAGIYQDVPVTPNTLYEYSGYLRNGDGADLTFDYLIGDTEAFLKIVWLDSDLSEISAVENNLPPQGLTSATARDDMWLLNELLAQSPPDAAFARVMAVYNDPDFIVFETAAWFDTLDFRTAIPEPSSLLLGGIALVVVSASFRKSGPYDGWQ